MAQAYRGAIGRTRTTTLHVSDPRGTLITAQVITSIDACLDPELAERLRAGTLNSVPLDSGPPMRVTVPVVYHDPQAELFVLVLDDAHRHREIDERIALLEQLRADASAVPVYVRDFTVVFGGDGLRATVERHARERQAAADNATTRAELTTARAELTALRAEVERIRAHGPDTDRFVPATELDVARTAPIDPRKWSGGEEDGFAGGKWSAGAGDPEGFAGGSGSEARALDPPPRAASVPPPPAASVPWSRRDRSQEIEIPSEPLERGRPTLDQLTTKVAELPRKLGDAASPELAPGFHLERGGVRLVAVAGDQLARELSGPLDLRLLLHRCPTYPVISLVIGAPDALRTPDRAALVVAPLDLAHERDRGILYALGKSFEITVELVTRGQRARRRRLSAPLTDNVAYIVGAADEHLRGISLEDAPDYGRARDLVLGAGFDLLGIEHSEHTEFRDDKLAQTATAQQVRRALAMARRFSRPAREDYLICTRGYPLVRWHQLRRAALSRAVAWGLWMGPELALIAVAEGLARSRRELVIQLERGFEHLRLDPGAFDLDAAAAADNAEALAAEVAAAGLEPRAARNNGTRAIASDIASAVSGSIGAAPVRGTIRTWSTDALISALEGRGPDDDHTPRLDVALALCERGEPRAARAIVMAAGQMNRGEAVRVFARMVRMGPAAVSGLVDGLSNGLSYVRHGAVLALVAMRTDEAVEAVIDLLLSERTELWREIARAIGRIGAPALMPLASHTGGLGDRTPAVHERVAWAMAHIGARGGGAALATLAAGQSVVAPIATKALALIALAAGDHVREPGSGTGERDATVNHAFSRQFFEVLERGAVGDALVDDAAEALLPTAADP